jgi:hypothetical protein
MLRLPIAAEPAVLPNMRKSQLVRASFPWVNHWREPLLELMRDALRLARTAYHYKKYTNSFTLQKAIEMKRERGVNLHIMRDLDLAQSDKGEEVWTTRAGSRRADRLFSVVGFARRDAPDMFGPGIYERENRDGILGYAQAMVYNANPQHGPSGQGLQPEIGWDTLNWVSPVLEHNSHGGNSSDSPAAQPQILLNWQAKLVPVTRLNESAVVLEGRFRQVVRRLVPQDELFRTH